MAMPSTTPRQVTSREATRRPAWRNWRSGIRRSLSVGSARRSIGGPGHNDDRSKTPRHSRPPGKTVDAVALRGSPSPPFRRNGTTATRHGEFDLIYRGCLVVFSGGRKKPGRRLTVGVFPSRLRPYPTTRASTSLGKLGELLSEVSVPGVRARVRCDVGPMGSAAR